MRPYHAWWYQTVKCVVSMVSVFIHWFDQNNCMLENDFTVEHHLNHLQWGSVTCVYLICRMTPYYCVLWAFWHYFCETFIIIYEKYGLKLRHCQRPISPSFLARHTDNYSLFPWSYDTFSLKLHCAELVMKTGASHKNVHDHIFKLVVNQDLI